METRSNFTELLSVAFRQGEIVISERMKSSRQRLSNHMFLYISTLHDWYSVKVVVIYPEAKKNISLSVGTVHARDWVKSSNVVKLILSPLSSIR